MEENQTNFKIPFDSTNFSHWKYRVGDRFEEIYRGGFGYYVTRSKYNLCT